MAAAQPAHRCVTWPQFATTMTMLAALLIGACWTVYARHESGTHADSVSYREFEAHSEAIVGRLDRIENGVERIQDKLGMP